MRLRGVRKKAKPTKTEEQAHLKPWADDPLINGVVRFVQALPLPRSNIIWKEDVTDEIITISWLVMNRVKLWAKFSRSRGAKTAIKYRTIVGIAELQFTIFRFRKFKHWYNVDTKALILSATDRWKSHEIQQIINNTLQCGWVNKVFFYVYRKHCFYLFALA